MINVSSFQDMFLGNNKYAYVCIGNSALINNFFHEREIAELFGREICYLSEEFKEEFLGVYGRRRCSSFRSELRKRGAFLNISKKRPDDIKLKYYLVRW